MLDNSIDKETYDAKLQEIEESLNEIDYKLKTNREEISEATNYEQRIVKFRKILSENSEIEEFDRAIFESVIDCVIIGAYDEEGNPDPTILTFVYKTGVNNNNLITETLKRDKIVIAKKYSDDTGEESTDNRSDKLSQLPQMAEIFSFDVPYQHMVFNKSVYGNIEKTIKNECQVRVAIAV